MDSVQRRQLLDLVLWTLRILQRIHCPQCYKQLGPHFNSLARFICCTGCHMQPESASALLRYQHAMDTFGCQNSLDMSMELHRFSDDLRSLDWAKQLGSRNNFLCVLLHLVLCRFTRTDWICKNLQHQWLGELQEAVVQDEEALGILWDHATMVLQVLLLLSVHFQRERGVRCTFIASADSAGGVLTDTRTKNNFVQICTKYTAVKEDGFTAWICHQASQEGPAFHPGKRLVQLGRCFQAVLFSIAKHLPDLCLAMAYAGLQTVVARKEVSPGAETLAALFLSETSFSGAFRSLCLAAGMNSKGE